MFILTVFVYPAVLALLCLGAGLLLDRVSAATLPAGLLLVLGVATLLALSQLTTYLVPLAPATPYLAAALAACGIVAGRRRLLGLGEALRDRRSARLQAGAAVLAYLLAIAPVLLAGRASLSSYMTLTDSVAHIVGAGYLIHHGQSFAHLDLRNSYGLLIDNYFNTGYPSGADTFFGASALLMRLPLIWAFQPFNAFVLATAVGPAWLLVRRAGLEGLWAALAALAITVPALVYAYELIASVKEVTTVPVMLGLGALVAMHRRWLTHRARSVVPFAVLVAAGVSAIGVGFGVWALGTTIVLAVALGREMRLRRSVSWSDLLGLLGVGALALVICALPTWAHLSGSVQVATTIAKTHNPGNLKMPLQTVQVLGVWLSGSYLKPPTGILLTLTDVLTAMTGVCAALGALHLLRMRRWGLAGWIVAMLAAWYGLTLYGTTWVDAKGLVLTSPVIALLAWAGVAALRSSRLRPLAVLLATIVLGGVLLSDAMQYRASALAPTGRYEALASIGERFAGRGPTLFTDFDEYALYELRSLEVGGPDFIYAPPALRSAARGHGRTVDLVDANPDALRAYRLIVTRRDPAADRPPSAYRLVWQDAYYEVWSRRHGAPAALAVAGLPGKRRAGCRRIAPVARIAHAHHAMLVAATHPSIEPIGIMRAPRPASWTRSGPELVLGGGGRLRRRFHVSRSGRYELWLRGELMPRTLLGIDGRQVAALEGDMAGNGDSPDTIGPVRVHLSAGTHLLTVRRSGFALLPGNGAHAYIDRIFLTPTGAGEAQRLVEVAPSRWRSLCGRRLNWVEAVRR